MALLCPVFPQPQSDPPWVGVLMDGGGPPGGPPSLAMRVTPAKASGATLELSVRVASLPDPLLLLDPL